MDERTTEILALAQAIINAIEEWSAPDVTTHFGGLLLVRVNRTVESAGGCSKGWNASLAFRIEGIALAA